MFKKIFILFAFIYSINLNSAQHYFVNDIRVTEQYRTLGIFYDDAFALPHPVDFNRINASHLISVMAGSVQNNCQILTQLIADKFTREVTIQTIYILNNIILILIQNGCLNYFEQTNLLKVLLNLNFKYAILEALPKNCNFILGRMHDLRENIRHLNKADKYLFLQHLFCSLRNKFEADDSEYISTELSYFLSLHDKDCDLIDNRILDSLAREMKNLIEEKISESNYDRARCLAIINVINVEANKNSKAVFIIVMTFASYLSHLNRDILNAKCVNLIIQILQKNNFEDYGTAFDKDGLLAYFKAMNPDNVSNLHSEVHIKILESVYSENALRAGAIEYVSSVENLDKCNSIVFSEALEQAFKDQLIRDIIENQKNKSFCGLLWYIKHSSENEGFENKLSSDNLQMILEYLESRKFSDLPQLSQKEWVSLVRKKYIASVRSEQSLCCIS